jgi:hypothetical protein
MVVFAAAGLDAMVKYLSEDCLSVLVAGDRDAQRELQVFASRRLGKSDDEIEERDEETARGTTLLGRVMVSASPRDAIVSEYVRLLRRGSLQSTDELMKAVRALGLRPETVGIDASRMRPIFKTRNLIIHELDINFDHPRRNRETRSRSSMVANANSLLDVAESVLRAVENKVNGCRGAEA